MNVLITGTSGFIGNKLCSFLESKLHTVFKVSRIDNSFNAFKTDLTDEKSVKTTIERLKSKNINIVIHLAAILASIEHDENEQIDILIDNITMTKNVISIIKALKPQKLINFSSMAVYPNIDGSFDENSQIRMSDNTDSMYGLSKFCSENMFDYFLKNYEIVISHLRIAQVHGEGMREDRIIPIMRAELNKNNSITVFGNGERISNFIEINELLDIVYKFINNDYAGVYNIGGENLSYLQLAEDLINKYGNSNSKILKVQNGSKSKFNMIVDKFKSL